MLTTLLLVSCGGGGGGQATIPPPPNASFSYASPPPYVVGNAIAPLAPSVKGSLFQFYCADLPPGLTVDPNTGVISGRPAAPRATSVYTVVAYTAPAQGTAVNSSVTLTVDALGPGLISYGAAAFTFTAGVPATILTPQAGSPVSSWSIAPQLPAGLSFGTVDGSISGTPTAASPRTSYTVTAQGAAATPSVTFAVEVDTQVLVDLGHTAAIQSLQFDGSSVLSEDANGRWVLWNYATGAMIASGDVGTLYPIYSYPNDLNSAVLTNALTALAGGTAVIRTPTGLEVRTAATGAATAELSETLSWWWSLATDGSYIATGDSTGLRIWSPSGQLLISRSGNYVNAVAFAAPGTLRIALGPTAASAIEAVSVPGGADVLGPTFKGEFSSWFVDGSGFFTIIPGSSGPPVTYPTLLAYSDNAVQEGSLTSDTLPSTVYGQGSWVWAILGSTLTVYALASPLTPIATYASADVGFASGSTFGFYDSTTGKLSVIDLSGTAPVKTDYAIPLGTSDVISKYAAESAAQWITGSDTGVLFDGASLAGTPRFLDYGEATSIAGSTGRIAIATTSGRILYFNATTLAQEGTIQFSFDPTAKAPAYPFPELALSSDGSTMAFLSPQGTSVNVYSLPSGSLLYSWPYPVSAQWLAQNISLSASGTVLGVSSQYLPGYNPLGSEIQTAGPATGGTPIFTSQWNGPGQIPLIPPLRLSPDGTQIATSTWSNPDFFSGAPLSTQILKGGSMAPFVTGWPVGWIDNTHLLVTRYAVDATSSTAADYTGCTIYDLSGTATGTCVLPEVLGFQTVDSDTLYALNGSKTVSISTGAVSWQSGNPPPCQPANFSLLYPCYLDALAGSHAVLVSDSRVVVQSY